MNRRIITCTALLCLAAAQGHAGIFKDKEKNRNLSLAASLAIGPGWTQPSDQHQTFYLAPDIEKTYVPDTSSTSFGNGELFLGIQKLLSSTLAGQLGFIAGTTSHIKYTGTIWDDASPQFNNRQYQYRVQNTRVGGKAKLIHKRGKKFEPWISAAVGASFNQSSFRNTPLIFEAVPDANFASKTTSSFTYALGIGVQKQLNKNWNFGVGYEFSDLGKADLRRAPGQTLNSGLKMNHMYTHGAAFSLTFIPASPAEQTKNIKRTTRKVNIKHTTKKVNIKKASYAVQAAVFAKQHNAKSLVSTLKQKGYKASIDQFANHKGSYYRVLVGELSKKQEAKKLQQLLSKSIHVNGVVIRKSVS